MNIKMPTHKAITSGIVIFIISIVCIIVAAFVMFVQQPYTRTTPPDVVEEVGSKSKAAFRRWFKSNEKAPMLWQIKDESAINSFIDKFNKASSIQYSISGANVITYVDAKGGKALVVGDIHGDADVLDTIIKHWNKKDTLIFTGDYVDRGTQNLQVLLTICQLKIDEPNKVYLCRGNHESATDLIIGTRNWNETVVGNINDKFAFASASAKINLYEAICKFYATMPLIVIFNRVNMCLHGELPDCDATTKHKLTYDALDDTLTRTVVWGDYPNPFRTNEDLMKYNKDSFVAAVRKHKIVNYIKGHNHDCAGAKVQFEGFNYFVNASSNIVCGRKAMTFDPETLKMIERKESTTTEPTVIVIDEHNKAMFVKVSEQK